MPTAKAARKSVNWAIGIIGAFYLMTIALGFGAAALIKPGRDHRLQQGRQHGGTRCSPCTSAASTPPGRDPARHHLGGRLRHDPRGRRRPHPGLVVVLRARHLRQRHPQGAGHREGGDAAPPAGRPSASAPSPSLLGALARDLNVAGLVALAFAVAASANLPTILYSLFWKRFTTQGALWSIYGGLITAVGLVLFSPVVSGKPTSMFPDVDFHWFPLENPGLISIPVGFLLGWLGTLLSKEEPDAGKYAELEVRSLTGTGAH